MLLNPLRIKDLYSASVMQESDERPTSARRTGDVRLNSIDEMRQMAVAYGRKTHNESAFCQEARCSCVIVGVMVFSMGAQGLSECSAKFGDMRVSV